MAILSYATVEQVEAGFREFSETERAKCSALLAEAAITIDAYAPNAAENIKTIISCRMVRRAIGDADDTIPIGASQGSMSAGGYSQSWTVGSGSSGELFLAKSDKRMLGIDNQIGAANPLIPEVIL